MSKATRISFQKWLITKGCDLGKSGADGIIGSATKKAILSLFASKMAQAITNDQLVVCTNLLGDTSTARIQAIAAVESSGSGWFNSGLVKILYERHKFWKYNDDTSAPRSDYFNFPESGNYTNDADKNGIPDSWDKLLKACEYDPLAAFMSVSVGKFQVMGFHYSALGFETPWDMLYSCVHFEAGHYNLLVKYILANNLKSAFLKIGLTYDSAIPFALGYNGSQYAKYSYNKKIVDNYRKIVKG